MKHRKPRVPRRFRRMRLARRRPITIKSHWLSFRWRFARLAEAHDLVMWAALGLVALAFILRSPETMAEVRDAINARAFRRQAFREYLQAARPPWKRYEDW